MQTVIPRLYASAPESLPFAPSLDIHAFLLQRERGNLLVYSVGELEAEAQDIEELGGVTRRYLNHRHEAGFASEQNIGPLFVHENERKSVVSKLGVEGTFSDRHVIDDDFEIIPTPGHTSGATCFLWDNGEHRALFTGDTVYLDEGEWIAAVLESSDRAAYIESLELMRELDFDVLVPWAATGGGPVHATTDRSDARRRIEAILQRIKAGEDR